MEKIRLNPECISCLLNKHLNSCPESTDTATRIEYMQSILGIIANAPKYYSAPKLLNSINEVKSRMFGFCEDFGEIKRHFNKLMLDLEPQLAAQIDSADDPLRSALCCAMAGNYIDFGTRKSVDEDELKRLMYSTPDSMVDEAAYRGLREDLAMAKRLVYLTDNCGEIVMDKIFINTITAFYPDISVTVIVRGGDILNDATMEDAVQVGLAGLVRVIDNGNNIAGTWLEEVSAQAMEEIDNADVIIAKGQANFESLYQCGRNIYYAFMCKCKLFADRFNVPMLHGILVNDKTVCSMMEGK